MLRPLLGNASHWRSGNKSLPECALPELGENPEVATASFGSERDFVWFSTLIKIDGTAAARLMVCIEADL